MHARSEWTTRPVLSGTPHRSVPFGFVHHEGGAVRGVPKDKGAVLREIEAGVLGKGYVAIDYNLMVFNDGDVWEGRGETKEDGATIHHNADGFSVCAVGNYEREPASDALVSGLGAAFQHAMATGWLSPTAQINPHRAVFATACPGANLYARMGDVRKAIVGGSPVVPEDDVEHGFAVDVVLNPTNPAQGYELDRFGAIHPIGGAPRATGGPSWAGSDVARRIVVTAWATPKGYVLDLLGAMHPFVGAPALAGVPSFSAGKIVPFDG